MNNFSTFFFIKLKRSGRSFGKITVRHRGAGYFKKISKTLRNPFFFDYSLFTFLNYINFSGSKFPVYVFIISANSYLYFTTSQFDRGGNFDFRKSSFSFLKLRYSSILPTPFLDEEYKPFAKSLFFTDFFTISNSAFLKILNNYPCKNFQYARSVDSYARFLKTRGSIIFVKLPSSKLIKFRRSSSFICFGYKFPLKIASLKPIINAGYNRNYGIRPTVRGVAINPVDHPHGGRTGESRPSVSPWAQLTKGYPTVRRR